jgi:hypothetical protein
LKQGKQNDMTELTDEELYYASEEDKVFFEKCVEGLPTRKGLKGDYTDKYGIEIPYGSEAHIVKYFRDAIETVKPESILEIGLNLGYGSAMLLELFKGFIFSADISDRGESFEAGKFLQMKYPHRFAFTLKGVRSSMSFLNQFKWDMIFIDGGHEEPDVIVDIEFAKEMKIPYLLFDDVYPRFGPGVLPAIEKFPELELVKDMHNLRLYKFNF